MIFPTLQIPFVGLGIRCVELNSLSPGSIFPPWKSGSCALIYNSEKKGFQMHLRLQRDNGATLITLVRKYKKQQRGSLTWEKFSCCMLQSPLLTGKLNFRSRRRHERIPPPINTPAQALLKYWKAGAWGKRIYICIHTDWLHTHKLSAQMQSNISTHTTSAARSSILQKKPAVSLFLSAPYLSVHSQNHLTTGLATNECVCWAHVHHRKGVVYDRK